MFVLTGFWLCTLAGVTLIHWILPERWRGWWLALASAAFLGWLSPLSLAFLSGLTLAIYFLTAKAERISGRKLLILIALAGGLLALCKTHMALIQPVADLGAAGNGDILIPLGLSYYTLRCLHYGIEKCKGTIPAHPFRDFIFYIFYLPTFMTGPIHRFPAFEKDMRRKRWDPFVFARGLERILFGYVKICFCANLLATGVFGQLIETHAVAGGSLEAWLLMIQNGITLYFQFAGASDIAIGFGLLLGFNVMENFNFPFLARNISDFWTRWHISLTSWCRDYVYMGTAAVTRNTMLAALASMLAMGLWHEVSWRYLIWGLYQGAGILIWQKFQTLKPHLPRSENKYVHSAARAGSTILTLLYVMLAMYFVRFSSLEESFSQAAKIVLPWR